MRFDRTSQVIDNFLNCESSPARVSFLLALFLDSDSALFCFNSNYLFTHAGGR
jgi:hypothetical protein